MIAPAKDVHIIGVGSCTPDRVLTNQDLEKIVDTSDEWITSRTGIKERRISDPDTPASALATEAVRRALNDAGVETMAQYEADPAVEALLHFVNADPNRTPSFTVFPKGDFFLSSGTSDSCAAGTTAANDLREAGANVRGSPPPYGFNAVLWRTAGELATQLEQLLTEGSNDDIRVRAEHLRNTLAAHI